MKQENLILIGALGLGGIWMWNASKGIQTATYGLGSGIADTSAAVGNLADTTSKELRRTVGNVSEVINIPLETGNTVFKSIKSGISTGISNVKNLFAPQTKTVKINTPQDVAFAKNIYSGVTPTVAAKAYYSGNTKSLVSVYKPKTLKK